jgi:hypothetical protein
MNPAHLQKGSPYGQVITRRGAADFHQTENADTELRILSQFFLTDCQTLLEHVFFRTVAQNDAWVQRSGSPHRTALSTNLSARAQVN